MPPVKWIAPIAAFATLAIHLVANPHYGFYRDELYFIICGLRPDWGYVDQPPLVPLLCALSQTFGHSLFALRALPAIFAAGGVYVTCLLVAELGGGAFAIGLAALLVAGTPILASFGAKVSTDMPGLLLWPLLALLLMRLIRGGDRRLWLIFGAVAGIAFESKYSVALYVAALLAALVVTGSRSVLATRWAIAGAGIAAAIALPNGLWQGMHGFPIVELLRNQQNGKVIPYTSAQYALQQVLITNPFFAPIWIGGIAWAFSQRNLRWIAWAFVLFSLAVGAMHGKFYYPGNVYPLGFAVGAIALERYVRAPVWRSALIAATALAAILPAPFIYPILPETQLSATIAGAGRLAKLPLQPERQLDAPIGESFADMHGWPELTATVASVYDSLPPRERAHAAILAWDMFEAAAIDFYGSTYHLPPAISGHNNYYVWGSRGYDGSVVIEVNGTCAEPGLFAERTPGVAYAHSRWALPAENDIPISLCKRARESLAAYWPKLKRFW